MGGSAWGGSQVFAGMLERVSDGIVALDREWRYTYVNRQAAALFGRTPEQLAGKHIWTEFPEGIGQPFQLAYERAMATQEQVSFEDYYAPWNRWFENRVYPSPEGLTIFFHEITDRKLAERAEHEAAERLRLALAAAEAGVWDWDLTTNRIIWSPEHERLWGLAPGTFRGTYLEFEARVHPEDRADVARAVRNALEARTSFRAEYRLLLPDGTVRWVAGDGHAIYGEDGTPRRMLGTVVDSTARRRAELLVECQSRALGKVALGASAAEALEELAKGVECLAPGMLCSVLLLETDGRRLRHAAGPSLPPEYREAIDGAEIGPRAGSCGTAAFTGEPVYVADIATDPRWEGWRGLALAHGLRACWSTPLFDRQRQVRGTFALYFKHPGLPEPWHARIISMATNAAEIAIEAERTRGAHAEAERRYRDLYDNAPDIFLSVDLATRTALECNAAVSTFLGWERSEVVGSDPFNLYHPDSREVARAAFAELAATGEVRDVELRVLRKDGGVLDVSLSATAERGPDGKPVRSRSIWRDISRRKRAEDELRTLSATLLRSQDDERRRIARELHDTTVQNLAALGMNLALLRPALAQPGGAADLLDECIGLTDRSAAELRTLSYVLHPPLLEALGLVRAARELAEGFTKRSGIQVSVVADGSEARLPREIELALFRVLQEALANVHRHSGSGTASVRVAREADGIALEVTDAGGSPAEPESDALPGVGIAAMRERLRPLGGRLDVAIGPGGSRVRAVVPVPERVG